MMEITSMADLFLGWNTWNSRSVLSHVHLPSAFAINLGIKEYRSGMYLADALIGRKESDREVVVPGPRSYDGAYTDLRIQWRDLDVRVETGVVEGDWIALATPIRNHRKPACLIARAGFLWNRPGSTRARGNRIDAAWPGGEAAVFATRDGVAEFQVPSTSPYLALPLEGAVGLSSGKPRSTAELRALLDRARSAVNAQSARFGPGAECHEALRSCLAWNTIYDPAGDRVISPVSRLWNEYNGGWVLFCWDTFFAAWMAAIDNPALACANARAILNERTPEGFVPNTSNGHGFKTLDRSQPPVGAMSLRAIYHLTGDCDLVSELFEPLLEWNRWWLRARKVGELLTWGSVPYEPRLDNEWETKGVGDTYGCALESGLDNSPMYDGVPVDPAIHCLRLHDVGLNSLYVRDCEDLAALADTLGHVSEAQELRARAESFRSALCGLWNDEFGLFLNRRTDTREWSYRLSPTLFYPLLAGAATPEQARRMVAEHLLNPAEFWGDWVLPSIARNDPAFPEQHYWRGRIWPPMNFLVYLGLRRAGLKDAQAALAEKSRELFLREWRRDGHVHENYSAIDGWGCPYEWSDRFYHWGGLLGLIPLIESGAVGIDGQ